MGFTPVAMIVSRNFGDLTPTGGDLAKNYT
jgi:hypothetical protein